MGSFSAAHTRKDQASEGERLVVVLFALKNRRLKFVENLHLVGHLEPSNPSPP